MRDKVNQILLDRHFVGMTRVFLVIYALLLGYMSLRYFPEVPPEDKPVYEAHGAFYLHLLAYAIFGGLVSLASHQKASLTVMLMAGVLAYSGLLELLQSLTGYREASWSDFIANGLGILLGWVFYLCASRFILRSD